LLSIWDDFEVMLNSTVLCGALVVLIPARNALDLNNGHAACGLKTDLMVKLCGNCGCNDRDAGTDMRVRTRLAGMPCLCLRWLFYRTALTASPSTLPTARQPFA
jgi:hypothetical protein